MADGLSCCISRADFNNYMQCWGLFAHTHGTLAQGLFCIWTLLLAIHMLVAIYENTRSFAHHIVIYLCQKVGQKTWTRPGAPRWDPDQHLVSLGWIPSISWLLVFPAVFVHFKKNSLSQGFISILKDIFVLVNFWSRSSYFRCFLSSDWFLHL